MLDRVVQRGHQGGAQLRADAAAGAGGRHGEDGEHGDGARRAQLRADEPRLSVGSALRADAAQQSRELLGDSVSGRAVGSMPRAASSASAPLGVESRRASAGRAASACDACRTRPARSDETALLVRRDDRIGARRRCARPRSPLSAADRTRPAATRNSISASRDAPARSPTARRTPACPARATMRSRDFALHEIHGALGARRLERVKENRRRDVVRHVADEHVRPAGELAERHLEHVRLDDEHVGASRVALAQQRGERAIVLDRDRGARARSTSRSVSAPRPGPISTTVSSPVSSSASAMRSRMRRSVRKCWPRLLRVGGSPRATRLARASSVMRSALENDEREIVAARRRRRCSRRAARRRVDAICAGASCAMPRTTSSTGSSPSARRRDCARR